MPQATPNCIEHSLHVAACRFRSFWPVHETVHLRHCQAVGGECGMTGRP